MSNINPSKLSIKLRDVFKFEEELSFVKKPQADGPALIIVDVQNDFLPGGQLAVVDGDKIIPVINTLQNQFEVIVLTQDWHPPEHSSFISAHSGIHENSEELKQNENLWPDHCIQGTYGASFSASLDTSKANLIVRKGTSPSIDSYSAFFDNEKAKSTGLAGYLIEMNIDSVVVCGLAADYCVYFTAMDALDLGFEATIALDATKAISDAGFKKKLELFTEKGGRVL